MLSEKATKNIADAFHRAAAATLVRNPGDTCNIVTARDRGSVACGVGVGGVGGAKLLMITISSFTFRLLTVFEVCEDEPTRHYYLGGAQAVLDEAFAEVANMCCGALNRELSAQFRHMAMSIPHLLDARCTAFLQELKPRFRESYDITINAAVRLRVTLCLCCNRSIEFAGPAIEVSHAGGELELF
jgi:hypothetical protein